MVRVRSVKERTKNISKKRGHPIGTSVNIVLSFITSFVNVIDKYSSCVVFSFHLIFVNDDLGVDLCGGWNICGSSVGCFFCH